jgi:hypothetical protein
MYTDQNIFIDAATSKPLISQLLGPARFCAFAEEAQKELEQLSYQKWSPEFLADFICEEMRNPVWQGRQPGIAEYQKMVAESKKSCRHYEILAPYTHAKLTLTKVNSIDDFEFARAMLLDLFEFYSADTPAKGTPPVYLVIIGRKSYSEMQLTIFLSGVVAEIIFSKKSP